MTQNPPYVRPNVRLNLNSNELYNLQTAAFPGGITEGQFSFPKGGIDRMDFNRRPEFTKVREFMEETKYSSPTLLELVRRHYEDPSFISILNAPENQVYEDWIGLDHRRYSTEYAIFVIESIDDLQRVANNGNSVNPHHITSTIPYSAIKRSHQKKYIKKMAIPAVNDSEKMNLFVSLPIALEYTNFDKAKIFRSIDPVRINEAIKKYTREEGEKKNFKC